ncbi:metallophosphoesterase [Sulfurimonas sp.]
MPLQVGYKYFPFKEISLEPKAFSPSIKNLRIIQLSDLHLSKNVKLDYLKSLVEKINSKNPDLVVFTGDIIQIPAKNLKKHFEIFRAIEAPSYYVTGNHDIFYGPKVLKELLSKNDVICLDNEITTIEINNSFIQLVGISDRYSFARGIKRGVKKLFSELNKELFTILLAHQPKDIYYIEDENRIDIQLSGHTHGGQVYPFNYVVKFFQPYFAGLYTHNKTLLYVTNGLGYWGVGIRYKVPSEIPVITIN